MNLFKKALKTKISLIKTVELKPNGWETFYTIKVNDSFVSGSFTESKEAAELFFDKILEAKGLTSFDEVIKQEYV